MRMLVLGLVLAGCNSGVAPPLLEQDASIYEDGGGGDGGAAVDLAGADLVPAACTTACDCAPGNGCLSGRCSSAALATHCCTATPCPAADACEFPNGTVAQCGTALDGGVQPPDGGAMDAGAACSAVSCTSPGNTFCKIVCFSSTAQCTAGHCVPN